METERFYPNGRASRGGPARSLRVLMGSVLAKAKCRYAGGMLKAMPLATHISVEEYLRTAYDPDCEYVDGEVLERNLGEQDHSLVQGRIYFYFQSRAKEFRICVFPEWRTQVSETRFRVPDVCVLRAPLRRSRILTTPPYILIEILSPEDTWRRMQERIDDYRRFSVENLWVVDPAERRAWRVLAGLAEECTDLMLTTTDGAVTLPLPEIFAAIDDEMTAGS